MKKIVFILFGMVALSSCENKKEIIDIAKERAAIEAVIMAYQDALNASDANKIVSLFTSDGIVMGTGAPTVEGTKGLEANYEGIFSGVSFSLKFNILEVELQNNLAFVRSTSQGTLNIKSDNLTVPDEFREIFILKKENNQWKLARYIYNQPK